MALFYDSTRTTHPAGGPLYVNASGTPLAGLKTPNYIFYYDQTWKNRWLTEVRFANSNSSSYTPGTSYVQVGWDVHGLSGTIGPHTYLFARESGANRLVFAGYQVIRGLDLYARAVHHECVHKRVREALQAGAIDRDPDPAGVPVGDGLPDNIETQIGTSVSTNNSVPWNTPYGTHGDQSDGETFARMCERDLPGVPDADWASDGFKFGNPEPPNNYQRVREYIDPAYTKASLRWIDANTLVP